MEISNKFVIYRLQSIVGSDYKALEEVNFPGWTQNVFDTEEEAIEAIVTHKMTYEDLLILKKIYIRT